MANAPIKNNGAKNCITFSKRKKEKSKGQFLFFFFFLFSTVLGDWGLSPIS